MIGMAYEVKVTRQGQVTIPKALRDKYGIGEGDKVIYVDLGCYMAVLPVPKDPVKALAELKIRVGESVHEMKEEALKTALKLVEEKHET
ncbi:MAG: AbrB family transcriptional regulator [Candidatus Methanomethylicota archaeon]|uniref:AbrB family transcriptional regulator n=1 Tax=Thermoproteota archaeon TaxID=2056631 RepID=A0A497EP31_9CREN|nr:MAG: AbrB family transcriptional regulator [Candidatus Verstraetearchaeota archaeon]